MLSFLRGGGGASDGDTVPLFPLHTVLFPGGVLPLKVFETRYVEMTKACLKDERPFGVCLLTRGDEVARKDGEPPAFATIGTLARIASWDMPQLGILHIATEGLTRFRVDSHRFDASGLAVGRLTALAPEPSQPLAPKYEPLARLLELIATRVGPANFPAQHAYDDASWVGYRLAELLPLPLHIKQSMLEINDPGVRLDVLQKFLRQQGLI
jgi:Lon protease-like protein